MSVNSFGSRASSFSLKSQVVIDQQNQEIEKLKRLLLENGLTAGPTGALPQLKEATLTEQPLTGQSLPGGHGPSPGGPFTQVRNARKRRNSHELGSTAKGNKRGQPNTQPQPQHLGGQSSILPPSAGRLKPTSSSRSMPMAGFRTLETIMPAQAPAATTTALTRPATTSNLATHPTLHRASPAVKPQLEDIGVPCAEGLFDIKNDKEMRQEIEILILTLNGKEFRGSITPQEAKFIIYRDCLGFEDFSNFNGVRFGFKGKTTATFMLKEPINVDELLPIQNFNFERKSTFQGRTKVDLVGCKIKGLRTPFASRPSAVFDGPRSEDRNLRLVEISGCENRVSKQNLLDVLENYGEVQTDIVEKLFEDGMDADQAVNGVNRTGIYLVRIKLIRDLPNMVPISGRRVRFFYPGIQILCTKCYGKHPKMACQSQKKTWLEYKTQFYAQNMDYPDHLVEQRIERERPALAEDGPEAQGLASQRKESLPGRSTESAKEATAAWINNSMGSPNRDATLDEIDLSVDPRQPPDPRDFGLPVNNAEREELIKNLMKGGTMLAEAEQLITMRKKAHDKAVKDYRKSNLKQTNFSKKKGRPSKHVAIENSSQ